jgi:hypothetical protein
MSASQLGSQTLPENGVIREPYRPPILRGEVESLELTRTSPSVMTLSINLRMELVNDGPRPVMFLAISPPQLQGALLSKDIDRSQPIVSEFYGEAVDTSPKWSTMRRALDEPAPPSDRVRILRSNESWKFEGVVSIAMPAGARNNSFSDKRESWESIQHLPNIWLRTICQVWPLNLERGNDRTELVFGKKLRTRWKNFGWLWLDGVVSEPIRLNLKTAVGR